MPTAQHDSENPWNPNARGMSRIKAAGNFLTEHGGNLIISGGYPNHHGFTYATSMAYAFVTSFPDLTHNLILVDGRGTRTCEDVFYSLLTLLAMNEQNGTPIPPSQQEILFCSEEPHFLRTKRAINTLGFTAVHLESGADHSIYSPKDTMMAEDPDPSGVFGLGPGHRKYHQGALDNANRFKEQSQAWADQNPESDADYLLWHETCMYTLRLRGTRFEGAHPALNVYVEPLPIPTALF